MPDLSPLTERLRKAEGPDRELDAAIVAALNNAQVRPYPPTDDFGPKSQWQFWSLDGAHFLGNESKFPVPPVTASVDAALALVARLLPGWDFILGRTNGGLTTHCQLGSGEMEFGETPALAILIALLTALSK